MKTKSELILGIEGGGTRTTWALLDSSGRTVRQGSVNQPGNIILLSDGALNSLFRSIRSKAGSRVDAIGGGFAGCSVDRERNRVRRAMAKTWPHARRIVAGNDSESALAGAHGRNDGICVIAGTGSNVVAQRKGKLYRAGGWGHLFADHGSGYDLARRGLEAIYEYYDKTGKVSPLGSAFLRATNQNSLDELAPWSLLHSTKTEVAALSPLIFQMERRGDLQARQLIRIGAETLATHTGYLARRMKFRKPAVCVVGGMFEKEPVFQRMFRNALHKIVPGARIFLRPPGSGAAAAAALANPSLKPAPATASSPETDFASTRVLQSPTEQRNPRSRGLQKKSIPRLVDLFIAEERQVERALAAQRGPLSRACKLVSDKLRRGGRLFYVGAGTSGRLGVVDASEMPPTFNAPPDQVQAIMAGGCAAVFQSQEGAEDDRDAGDRSIVQRGVRRGDVVCGIAASGQTAFVLAALERAKKSGAATLLLSCNPHRAPVPFADVTVDLPTGPEIVTGSTRLKAGTATKVALNMISTIAMIQLGRVRDNFMIDVQATNGKLRLRALRLVMALTGCPQDRAHRLLTSHGWNVRRVVEKMET